MVEQIPHPAPARGERRSTPKRALAGPRIPAENGFPMRWLLQLLLAIPRLLIASLRLLVRLFLRPRLPDYVELRIDGGLSWRELKRRGLQLGRRKSGPDLRTIDRLLAEAAGEPGIRGVLVRVERLEASRPRLLALRASLERMRAAGKEVVLYWKHADNRHFALVPAASRVILAPGGPVHLIGYAASVTVLGDLFDRLGLRPEFVRVGRWKVAPERFTEHVVTPEHRDLVERVLDRAWRNLVEDVASRRGGDEAWARDTIDGGPYTSRRALRAGLVDELAYPDELPERLGQPGEKARLAPLSILDRRRRWRMRPLRLGWGRVAVVPVAGLIKPGKSFRWSGGSFAGDESVGKALERAREDPRIRAVILAIDSRGGAANASELIWRAVRRCSAEKPTVAWVEGVAASGGYFVASGANRIVVAPGALVGSIGVFAGRFGARPLLDRLGVRQEVILRGARSGLLEPAHSLTREDRAILAAEIQTVYEEFLDRVAEGRGRTPEQIRPHAEGKVFLGAEAPEELVDEVGDFRTALARACEAARLDPERVELHLVEHRSVRPDLAEILALTRLAQAGLPLLLWPEGLEPPEGGGAPGMGVG